MLIVPDGSSVLGVPAAATAAASGVVTGSRLFHLTVSGGSRSTASGGSLLSAGGSAGGVDSLTTGHPMQMFGQLGSGGQPGFHRGGGGVATGLLPSSNIVMDAEGGLYTYTMDG